MLTFGIITRNYHRVRYHLLFFFERARGKEKNVNDNAVVWGPQRPAAKERERWCHATSTVDASAVGGVDAAVTAGGTATT